MSRDASFALLAPVRQERALSASGRMTPCPSVSTAPSHADVYVAAFVARCDVVRASRQPAFKEPGVLGLLPSAEHPVTRVLVIDDRAYDVLAALLPVARARMINVFAGAARCAELVDGLAAWRPEATTALIRHELRTVPAAPLPSALRLRRMRRLPDDPRDGVPLEDAAAGGSSILGSARIAAAWCARRAAATSSAWRRA
jgi:hypothetical protein